MPRRLIRESNVRLTVLEIDLFLLPLFDKENHT